MTSRRMTALFRELEASGVFEQRLRLRWEFIVTNAMKYAHPTGLPVEMTITATTSSRGAVAVRIADDGVGLPDGFVEDRDAGVGLRLVRSLMENVGARIEISSNELGLVFDVELSPSSRGRVSGRRNPGTNVCSKLPFANAWQWMPTGRRTGSFSSPWPRSGEHWPIMLTAGTARSGQVSGKEMRVQSVQLTDLAFA